MLGGVLRRPYQSLVGVLTQDALGQVRADRAFLGASGVRADGQVLDTTAVEVPVKRALIAAADQVVLLADRHKLPGHGIPAGVRHGGHRRARDQRRSRPATRSRRAPRPAWRCCDREAGHSRRRRVPRPPRVRRAAARHQRAPGRPRWSCTTWTTPPRRGRRTCSQQMAAGREQAPRVADHHRPGHRARAAPTSSSRRSASAAWPGAPPTSGSPSTWALLGQETTGPGGLAYGLRTVPVARPRRRARRGARPRRRGSSTSPTRPGMVTEAMQQVLGDRVVGICDSPIGLGRRAARALGLDPDRTSADYAGLNHLGWLRGPVRRRGATCCRTCWPTTPCWARSRRAGCSAPTGCAPSARCPTSTSTTTTSPATRSPRSAAAPRPAASSCSSSSTASTTRWPRARPRRWRRGTAYGASATRRT